MEATEKKPKILVVDDDPLTLKLLTGVLESQNYEVIQARNGEDALAIAVLGEPRLAMLDINMPGMSGLDLAKRLRSDSDIPFVFLSGVSDGDVVKRAVEYGASGYLVKPVDVQNLIPMLEAALARAGEIRNLRQRESRLTSALAAGRETSMAVGILMVHHRTDRQQAFDMLRSYARSKRKTINEVACEVLNAEEVLNQFRAGAHGNESRQG
ncbi:MAG TPA: response regulator [Burkholderiaceae bacterium]